MKFYSKWQLTKICSKRLLTELKIYTSAMIYTNLCYRPYKNRMEKTTNFPALSIVWNIHYGCVQFILSNETFDADWTKKKKRNLSATLTQTQYICNVSDTQYMFEFELTWIRNGSYILYAVAYIFIYITVILFEIYLYRVSSFPRSFYDISFICVSFFLLQFGINIIIFSSL